MAEFEDTGAENIMILVTKDQNGTFEEPEENNGNGRTLPATCTWAHAGFSSLDTVVLRPCYAREDNRQRVTRLDTPVGFLVGARRSKQADRGGDTEAPIKTRPPEMMKRNAISRETSHRKRAKRAPSHVFALAWTQLYRYAH
ncbi:hypothetical protein P4O66_006109 [Electrophorus voltai]|uniref:Uncharacterized protein n=1 Tax=Electrophorus voltai TaxID=2609070 RepID=A0AAD9DZJ8_9TELE|nr:hypothetical protein P4O66_006109 [Electrophorus voltai]